MTFPKLTLVAKCRVSSTVRMASAMPWSQGDGMVHVHDTICGPQSIVPGTVLVTVMLGRKHAVLTRRDDHSCVFTAPAYELNPDIEYEVINVGGGCERAAAAKRARSWAGVVRGRRPAHLSRAEPAVGAPARR